MAEMKERMPHGEPYIADDPDLAADHARAHALLDRYNATPHGAQDERDRLLRELLGRVGDGAHVNRPFLCDYGTPIEIGPARSSTPSRRPRTAARRLEREITERDHVAVPPAGRSGAP